MANLPANMGEALWIGQGAGSNFFNEGVGQGTTNQGGAHTDYTQAQIVSGVAEATEPTHFFLNGSGDPTFSIRSEAGTTSTGTQHPRSELRELLSDGDTKAAWDGRTGKHYMQGRSRITEFTDRRPWVCFFQSHGSSNSPNTSDLARVQTEGTNGTTTNLSIVCRYTPPSSSSETRVVLRNGYNVNTWVNWRMMIGGDTSADNGRLRVWLDDVEVLNVTGMGQIGTYFKTGCYLQDSVAEGATAGTGGTVEMERGSLQVWHTGYPAPTTPIFTGGVDGGGGVADATPPTIPSNVAAIRGDTTATLTWDASTDNVGVDHYVVRRAVAGGGGPVTTTADLGQTANSASTSASSANKTVVSKFTAGTTGVVTEGHARLWVDTGTASVEMVVYADSGGAPTTLLGTSGTVSVTNTTEAVKDFTFTGGNQAAITEGTDYWIGFTWADPGTNSVNWSRNSVAGNSAQNSSHGANPFGTVSSLTGPIDAYVVVSTTTTGDGATDIAHPTSTTYTDTGRTNGVELTYTISAVDAASNESGVSAEVTVTPGPADVTAPTVPASLVATAGDRNVGLSWSASTDADTGVRNYRVYRDSVLVGVPTVTAFVDSELSNGATYSYTVSAVDNSLNESAQSGAQTATPTAPALGGMPFLTGDFGTGAGIAVEFAFGADLTADAESWAWTDVTADVRQDPGISTSLGRNDESSTSNPAQFSLVLTNSSGDYSKGGRSRHWPYIRRNTPVRLRIDPNDGGGGRVVFLGGADGWTPGWDATTGQIPVVTLSASGTLRRLAQGDAPLQSAYRRAMVSASDVMAYWPMEEGDASRLAPAVRGGSDMVVTVGTPDWASDSGFFSSASLPKLRDGQLVADVNPYTDTGTSQVQFLLHLPDDATTTVPNEAIFCSIFTTGSIARIDLAYQTFPALDILFYGTDGTKIYSINPGFNIGGELGRLSFGLTQSGSDVYWLMGFTTATPGTTVSTTTNSGVGFFGTVNGGQILTGKTFGIVSQVQFNPGRNMGDTGIGHLAVRNTGTNIGTLDQIRAGLRTERIPLLAYIGEYATSPVAGAGRLERLCEENSVPLTRYGSNPGDPYPALSDADTVGPQLVAPLLTLLHEVEAADQGQIWDGRTNGLAYTTRRRREDGNVRLTIDASADELADSFAPVDDDQRTRNRVEVKRTHGISTTYQDSDGPLGTAVIGIYDDSQTVNLGRDADVLQNAQWRVGLGTVEGLRYPSVTVDLRTAPSLAGNALDIVPGERIDVVGLDTTLEQFTAASVSLIVEGIAHEITAASWRVTFQCSPFEPWAVGRVAAETGDTSDMLMRPDTDGAEVAFDAAAGDTSLSVATDFGAFLWTTYADDYPLTLSVGGLPVVATACSGATSPQTFTVAPLQVARTAGMAVSLWEPRRLGLGETTGDD